MVCRLVLTEGSRLDLLATTTGEHRSPVLVRSAWPQNGQIGPLEECRCFTFTGNTVDIKASNRQSVCIVSGFTDDLLSRIAFEEIKK